MIDTTNKNLRALSTLGQPVTHWDTLIIYLLSTKLDYVTSREWEQFRNTLNIPPTLQDFTKFLTGRADLLETLQDTKQNRRPEFQKNAPNFQKSAPNFSKTFVVNTQNNNSSYTCPMCNDNHFLHNCQSFRQLTVDERVRKVTELKVCLNCLRPGHINKKCRLSRCRYCNSKHNTLLHTDKETVHIPTIVENNVTLSTDTSTTDAKPSFVFLSTAMVMVGDRHGRLHKARLLLDNGSTANFVTDRLCTKLGLVRRDTSSTVTGIDNQATVTDANIKLLPRYQRVEQIRQHFGTGSLTSTCLCYSRKPNGTGLLQSS
ncbi:uncharacterized protein LOC105394901 isoform X3 [Plutella xylostella]|uniref:uncharacterized protein LOC105394901 isoform X3 n=1 Tax=Plutella xylostella TaxID=51655 RepID=UPI002032878E|nr:uncharacterized protein LOC105394901 isoform X3 [Plutella xylostella]